MCCRTSDNRVYMASLLRTSAQTQQSWTSDTLEMLAEIPHAAFKMNMGVYHAKKKTT